jgi:hypothetical protein
MNALLAVKAKHDDPVFTIKQIRDQGNLLVSETGPILNTKKPEPKTEEEPAKEGEDKPAEENAEMKDESAPADESKMPDLETKTEGQGVKADDLD